jgi:putative NADH-flavin reductase
MNVLVLGAAGKTGDLVVEKAHAAGHTVTAFVHSPDFHKLGVRILTGDAANPDQVRQAVQGQDAVIDTIGGKTPYKATDLETSTARNLIAAMQAQGVRRLLVISMMGIGDSAEQAPFWYEHLLMPTFLRGSTPDKTHMEETVKAGGIDYIIARPPLLTDDPATGSYQIIPAPTKAHKITRADLAQFLVDQLTADTYRNQAVVVANS